MWSPWFPMPRLPICALCPSATGLCLKTIQKQRIALGALSMENANASRTATTANVQGPAPLMLARRVIGTSWIASATRDIATAPVRFVTLCSPRKRLRQTRFGNARAVRAIRCVGRRTGNGVRSRVCQIPATSASQKAAWSCVSLSTSFLTHTHTRAASEVAETAIRAFVPVSCYSQPNTPNLLRIRSAFRLAAHRNAVSKTLARSRTAEALTARTASMPCAKKSATTE